MYNALLNNKIAQNNTLYKYSMLSCKFMNKGYTISMANGASLAR